MSIRHLTEGVTRCNLLWQELTPPVACRRHGTTYPFGAQAGVVPYIRCAVVYGALTSLREGGGKWRMSIRHLTEGVIPFNLPWAELTPPVAVDDTERHGGRSLHSLCCSVRCPCLPPKGRWQMADVNPAFDGRSDSVFALTELTSPVAVGDTERHTPLGHRRGSFPTFVDSSYLASRRRLFTKPPCALMPSVSVLPTYRRGSSPM